MISPDNYQTNCFNLYSQPPDFPSVDTTVLYKERYDNVADYKKKKQERIEMQEQKKLKHEALVKSSSKSAALSDCADPPSKKMKIDKLWFYST